MNEEVAYSKIVVFTNKSLIMNVGRFLDKGAYKLFNRNITYFSAKWLTP
jgi:hypothetical protein